MSNNSIGAFSGSFRQEINAREELIALSNLYMTPADVLGAIKGVQSASTPADINASAINSAKAGLPLAAPVK